jgi:aminoglycoside phosphotransferase (APT) family kinase protein
LQLCRYGMTAGTTLTRNDVGMAWRAATHEIHVDAGRGVVIKRFRSWDRREPAREWIALTLLAEFAPGLAAIPVRAGLTADPPVIEMSWLPGVPLGDTPLSAAQTDALALALDRLWNAVPLARLTDLGRPGLNVSQLARRVTEMLAAHRTVDDCALARQAWEKAADWFSSGALGGLNGGEVVLGQGDCNLANFLWDGTQVRLVDFEDSGPSDRAFELAVLVEHISAWSDAGLSADAFLAMFGLTAAEQLRVREYRRLAALFWLMMLLPGSPAHHRNPPGTLERQAARLLLLLSCGSAH